MRVPAVSTLIFIASAFVGPLIRLATWPPSKFEQGSFLSIGDFVYDLVLLLWPTQPLAVIEVNTGSWVAIVVSVAANILLFGLLGVVAGFSAKQRLGLLALYVVVCALVLLLALWGAGFSFAYLNVVALLVALLLYAVPFWATDRLAGNVSASRQTTKK